MPGLRARMWEVCVCVCVCVCVQGHRWVGPLGKGIAGAGGSRASRELVQGMQQCTGEG
jgi:hypothetical protein